MRKKLQITTAVMVLLAAPALAQKTTSEMPTTGQQTAPPSTQPAAPTAAAPGTHASGEVRFVDAQQADEMLASTPLGTQVYNSENQSLGEINDVVLTADGQLKTVVIGVGGFLGIAERDIAVPWETLGVSREEDQDLVLRLDVSREQLENAPEFESVEERRLAEEAARAAQTPPATGAGARWRRRLFRERHPPFLRSRRAKRGPCRLSHPSPSRSRLSGSL
jgi:sporulation protein YlmC with PRC-barrel domain